MDGAIPANKYAAKHGIFTWLSCDRNDQAWDRPTAGWEKEAYQQAITWLSFNQCIGLGLVMVDGYNQVQWREILELPIMPKLSANWICKFFLQYAFMRRIELSRHVFAYRFQHGTRPRFLLQVSITAATRVARLSDMGMKAMRTPATIS